MSTTNAPKNSIVWHQLAYITVFCINLFLINSCCLRCTFYPAFVCQDDSKGCWPIVADFWYRVRWCD